MRLFKYLHPDRTDVLHTGSIRFSSPRVLNDPFELKPCISAFSPPEWISQTVDRLLPEQSAKSYENLPAHVRAFFSRAAYLSLADKLVAPQARSQWDALMEVFLPKIRDVIFEKFEEMVGILCLTESPANLLMWAHYADAHQGFVVEFDPKSEFFNRQVGPDDELRHLRKVVYRDERPSIVLTDMDDFSAFLTKGKDWSYENEWRIMMPLSAASRVVGEGSTAIHLFEFPKNMIRGVVLGCRMDARKKEEIRNILCQAPECQQAYCTQARIDETHYRIDISD